MPRTKGRDLPKHCSWNTDQRGVRRVRFRKGEFSCYLAGEPWSDAFMKARALALQGEKAQRQAEKDARVEPGSVNEVIVSYYASSSFLALRDSSRRVRKGILERFRAEHGTKPVAKLTQAHISAIIGAMADRPEAGNNLLKALKVLLNHALAMKLVTGNPSMGVRKFRSQGSGFHSWTEDEIAAFENRHPTGTKARLALALLVYTGQRRGDVVRMGRQHIAGDVLIVKQQKTGRTVRIPLIHPALRAELDATTGNMNFLLTEAGAPFTPAGFGNWFRDRCNEAGLKHCSAHGLRKACATRLANAGCPPEFIKSITGHKTLSEVARYTEASDQERNARAAIERQMNHEQGMSSAAPALDKRRKKK